MKLLQDCWIALLELFNLATLSTNGESSLQQALHQPNYQASRPGRPKLPIFFPPSRPEEKENLIQCDYSAMGSQWSVCSSATDRNCWLKGPKGKRYDVLTNYETEYPKGVTRKVCNTFLNRSEGAFDKDLIDMIICIVSYRSR